MDGTMNSGPLSTKSPVFMDRKQVFYGLSTKAPLFVDNRPLGMVASP